MRVIKPIALSVLQRVLTIRREHHLSVGALVYFPLEAPELPLPEMAMWQAAAAQMGKDPILDEGMPKPRSEVLVHGKAFSPGGEPRPAFAARLRVGPADKPLVDKTIAVVGKRRWHLGAPTEPEPITEMRIAWENAFGGPDHAPNPRGMGAAPVEEGGAKVHWLPHLEDPRHLLKSPGDRPPPACFGALDPTLAARISKMGTYGAKWLEKESPGFAQDLDPEYFQMAPQDQRLPEYFQGGEAILLDGLSPGRAHLETHVPNLRARCFVQQKGAPEGDGEPPLREVAMRLETVILFPNVDRGVALFRGVTPIAEDDAEDVTVLLAALEGAGAPRPVEHYRKVLAQRIDKDTGHLHGLRDQDLLPERDPGAPSFPDEALGDMDDLLRRDRTLEKRSRARAQRELDQARLQMRLFGMDPDDQLPKEVAPLEQAPKLGELAELAERMQAQAAEMEKDAEARQKTAMEDARRRLATQGLDFDAMVEQEKRKGGGPPKFSADEELARMRELAEVGRKGGVPMHELEAKIEDPAFVAHLRRTEEALNSVYRAHGHLFEPAKAADEAAMAALRAEAARALEAGEPLARRDLTGVDLRGLSLTNADLREALLEGADLSGCDCSGADLSGAILARAILTGTRFEGATLAGTNLGEARARGARFEGADLRKAVFHKAHLEGAVFSEADLTGADFFQAVVTGADFRGANAEEVLFFQLDLTGARFAGAKLRKATLFQCKGKGVDFSGAMLEDASFVELEGEQVSFQKARAARLRVVSRTAMPGADFSGADLTMANLRGCNLEGASFEGASADGADFSEATLKGARMASLSAKGARFTRTDLSFADLTGANLMDALLQKAKLAGARLERANLFSANLMQARGDDQTSFSGAHVKRVLFTKEDA